MKYFLLFVLLLVPIGSAIAKPPPLTPGIYTDWDGEIDEVQIFQTFHLRDYNRVLVLPINPSGITMPTDNTRRPVEKNLAKSTDIFVEEFDNDMPNKMKVKVVTAPANTNIRGNPGALILRAKFREMDPGTSAGRTFSLGFAGATHVTLAGEFIDGATGKTLVMFSHHNYHSKAGIFNKYTAALEENEQQLAESISKLIKAFYP